MDNVSETRPVSKGALWTGRVLSALPALLLIFSAALKLARPEWAMKGFVEAGFPERLSVPLGVVELTCTLIYLIPQTSVLGAILLTGYLGGATATTVRIGQPWVMPVLVGVVVWLGLFLREPRLRELAPLRRRPATGAAARPAD
jgi:hypothetical protein